MIAATYRRPAASDVLERRRDRHARARVRARCSCELAVAGVNPTDWKSRAGHDRRRGVRRSRSRAGRGGRRSRPSARASRRRGWASACGSTSRPGSASGARRRSTRWCRSRRRSRCRRRELRPRRLARRPGADRLPLPVRRRPARRPAGARRGRRGRGGPRGDRARTLGRRRGRDDRVERREGRARRRRGRCVVNYREPGAAERIGKVDRIVEVALGPNLELDLAVANPHTVDLHATRPTCPTAEVPIRQLMTPNLVLRFVLVYTIPRSGAATPPCDGVAKAVDAGALTTLPLHRFPLADTAAAHDAVEARRRRQGRHRNAKGAGPFRFGDCSARRRGR